MLIAGVITMAIFYGLVLCLIIGAILLIFNPDPLKPERYLKTLEKEKQCRKKAAKAYVEQYEKSKPKRARETLVFCRHREEELKKQIELVQKNHDPRGELDFLKKEYAECQRKIQWARDVLKY